MPLCPMLDNQRFTAYVADLCKAVNALSDDHRAPPSQAAEALLTLAYFAMQVQGRELPRDVFTEFARRVFDHAKHRVDASAVLAAIREADHGRDN